MKFYISAAILCLAINCTAATIEGWVVAISDGDTITLVDHRYKQNKVRLTGIDAPEKGQPFGRSSKESLSNLIFGKFVIVETNRQDRYRRNLGKVLVDGVDANLEQINRGMAWHYKAYAREQPAIDRDAYSDAESASRAAKRGLWADAAPVPPWEYRRGVSKPQKNHTQIVFSTKAAF